MIDASKLVDFLSSMKISANQYLLCHLLYTKDFDTLKQYVQTSYKFKKKDRDLRFTQDEIDDLIDKGYLVKLFERDSPTSYMVTDKFTKSLFVEVDEAAEQLWDSYPKVLRIDGIIQSTRTCDKDVVMQTYIKRIGFSREKHREVMKMLERYKTLIKQGKMNSMGIEKWIKGENWEVVAEIATETEGWDELI